jgi:hypothetical protein
MNNRGISVNQRMNEIQRINAITVKHLMSYEDALSILNINGSPAPTKDVVKRQFKSLILMVHPDKNSNENREVAEKACKKLLQACDILIAKDNTLKNDLTDFMGDLIKQDPVFWGAGPAVRDIRYFFLTIAGIFNAEINATNAEQVSNLLINFVQNNLLMIHPTDKNYLIQNIKLFFPLREASSERVAQQCINSNIEPQKILNSLSGYLTIYPILRNQYHTFFINQVVSVFDKTKTSLFYLIERQGLQGNFKSITSRPPANFMEFIKMFSANSGQLQMTFMPTNSLSPYDMAINAAFHLLDHCVAVHTRLFLELISAATLLRNHFGDQPFVYTETDLTAKDEKVAKQIDSFLIQKQFPGGLTKRMILDAQLCHVLHCILGDWYQLTHLPQALQQRFPKEHSIYMLVRSDYKNEIDIFENIFTKEQVRVDRERFAPITTNENYHITPVIPVNKINDNLLELYMEHYTYGNGVQLAMDINGNTSNSYYFPGILNDCFIPLLETLQKTFSQPSSPYFANSQKVIPNFNTKVCDNAVTAPSQTSVPVYQHTSHHLLHQPIPATSHNTQAMVNNNSMPIYNKNTNTLDYTYANQQIAAFIYEKLSPHCRQFITLDGHTIHIHSSSNKTNRLGIYQATKEGELALCLPKGEDRKKFVEIFCISSNSNLVLLLGGNKSNIIYFQQGSYQIAQDTIYQKPVKK